jgi:hypothetical protein
MALMGLGHLGEGTSEGPSLAYRHCASARAAESV